MKNLLIAAAFLFVFNSFAFAETCLDKSNEVPPVLSENARKTHEANLAEARADYEKSPDSADAIIWLGRRTAYPGNYKEAIRIFSQGIEKFPRDARFYRHRGHRYITLRCFDDAISDFEKAAQLVKGKKDEIEPDGLPNARNIPTSTLQSNIFYHLGLAYYLKGDFKNALRAYREAEKVSTNPDMLVATRHWLYMTLRRLGRVKEARKSVADIKDNLDIIENDDYYKLVRLYQGKLKAEDLLKEIGAEANTLSNASLGYGLGNWFLYNGEREKALEIFRQIKSGNQWASFGYIAAERETIKQN
jgi:tetratricopeptide (TPR) repeat protein